MSKSTYIVPYRCERSSTNETRVFLFNVEGTFDRIHAYSIVRHWSDRCYAGRFSNISIRK